MLDFPVFRPLSKGQQCFLSYGPLPNLKLVLFYGMCVVDNPLDVVPVQLQVNLTFGWQTSGCLLRYLKTFLMRLSPACAA